MDQIIDVEYTELKTLEDKTIEELAAEANSLWQQAENIAALSMLMAAKAGQRLTVIKSRLAHGEWENWCSKNLKFSKSKAEKMMALGKRISDPDSIFAKTEMFTDIGISSIYALLAAPEDVAEEVLARPETPDMTVRELKDEIARLKAEKEQVKAEGDRALEETTERYGEKFLELEKQYKEGAAQQADPQQIKQLEAELASAKKEKQDAEDKLAREKEKAKALKAKIEEEQGEAVAAAGREAKEAAQKEFEQAAAELRQKAEAAEDRIRQLEHKLANNSQAEMAAFKVKADQLQQDFNACIASITTVEKENPEQAQKMRGALKMVLQNLAGTL